MKKMIAVLLCLCMLTAQIPAFAAHTDAPVEDYAEQSRYTDAIAKIDPSELGALPQKTPEEKIALLNTPFEDPEPVEVPTKLALLPESLYTEVITEAMDIPDDPLEINAKSPEEMTALLQERMMPDDAGLWTRTTSPNADWESAYQEVIATAEEPQATEADASVLYEELLAACNADTLLPENVPVQTRAVETRAVYYSGTSIPTYTYVTGWSLYDTDISDDGSIISYIYYLYEDDFVYYVNYLRNYCGWTLYDTTEGSTYLMVYLVKNGVMIALTADVYYDRVFVMLPYTSSVKPTSVSLDKTRLTLIEGNIYILEATVSPSNASDKSVTWSSSNTGVATVTDSDGSGFVQTKKAGSAKITATTSNGKTASCSITVKDLVLDYYPGSTIPTLTCVTGTSVDEKVVDGSTAMYIYDFDVASFINYKYFLPDNGWILVNEDEDDYTDMYTYTYVKGDDIVVVIGDFANAKIVVGYEMKVEIKPTGISLDKTSLTMFKGTYYWLVPTVSPSDATNKTVTWSSSTSSVVSVKDADGEGMLTALKPGTAKITAKTANGKTATCTVTVKDLVLDYYEATTIPTFTSITNKPFEEMYVEDSVATYIYDYDVNSHVNYEFYLMDHGWEFVWEDSDELAGLYSAGYQKNGILVVVVADFANLKSVVLFEAPDIPVTSVSFAASEALMFRGETSELNAVVSPATASDQTLTWASSNEAVVAIVDDGVIEARAPGTAVVTATSTNGKTARISITVGIPADGVSFEIPETTRVAAGGQMQLYAEAYCDNGTAPYTTDVIYEVVEGTDCATIDANGVLKGIKAGPVVVRATAKATIDDVYSEIELYVYTPVKQISVTPATAMLGLGDELQLFLETTPAEHEDALSWESSNEDVAMVDDNGVVTAIASGKVQITVKSESGLEAFCDMTVGVPADAVRFHAFETTNLCIGKTMQISAEAYCTDESEPLTAAVTYEIVEGQNCATIDANGELKGVQAGVVTIRATSVMRTDVYEESSVVICAPITKISVTPSTATMIYGETLALDTVITPATSEDLIYWSSANEDIATVNKFGLVTAHRAGKVKITATSGSGKSAYCTVTIGAPADAVDFTVKTTSLAVGKTLTLTAKAYREDGTKPISTAVTYEIVEGESFATLDAKGKLKGLETGEVIVRATALNGTEEAYDEIVINVCVPVTKVTLSQKTATMVTDGELQLTATATPNNHSDTITWSSANEDIATVDESGLVTAHRAGKVKITATSGSGKSAYCTVTVKDF